jgi:hypothetical protein
MKKLIRERVVPIIFGQRLLADIRLDRGRIAFLTEIRQQGKKSGQTLFARIELLVDRVFSIRALRFNKKATNDSENLGSSCSTPIIVDFPIAVSRHSSRIYRLGPKIGRPSY